MFGKKKGAILLASFIMFSCVGCNSSADIISSRPDKDMELKVFGSESLMKQGGVGNPWSNISFSTQAVFRNIFSIKADSVNINPDIANSYTMSEDMLTYEIIINDGLLWSDGEVLDAEDVIFSISAVLLADKANAIFTSLFSTIVGAEEFVNNETDTISGMVADGNKITITLLKPFSNLPLVLSQFAILPEHILNYDDMATLSSAEFWYNPVSSGLYKVGEYVPNESVEYVYNENYLGEAPYINSLILRSDYSLEELDYCETNDIAQILDYRAISNKTEHKVDNLFYRYFIFNMNKGGEPDPVMSDIRVREAITYAIDRKKLLSDIYYNTGVINNTGVVQDFNHPLDVSYTYDPEKAKQLLNEAEYDFNRPLVLLYYYSDETSIRFMEEVGKQLEEVGFTIEFLSSGNLYNDEFDNYDVGLKGLAAYSILEWYTEYQSINQMHTNVFGDEPMFDELIDEFNAVKDSTQRVQVLQKLQQLEYDLLYKFPVFTMGHMAYTNNDRVILPEAVVFGSPRYNYDIDIANWQIIK